MSKRTVLGFLDSLDQRWLVGAPTLEDGEVVLWSGPMGYIRDGVARGGILWVTQRRIIFYPNRIERGLGVTTLSWPLNEVNGIDHVDERLVVRGLGAAFVIRTTSGDVAEFTVYDPEQTVLGLRKAVFGPDGPL